MKSMSVLVASHAIFKQCTVAGLDNTKVSADSNFRFMAPVFLQTCFTHPGGPPWSGLLFQLSPVLSNNDGHRLCFRYINLKNSNDRRLVIFFFNIARYYQLYNNNGLMAHNYFTHMMVAKYAVHSTGL